jgi:Ring finger domain
MDNSTFYFMASRALQSTAVNTPGKAAVTILYIIALFLCFITPIFYYFRVRLEESQQRHLRELELATAMEISLMTAYHQENSLQAIAARQKYRDQKRATIVQLFRPVEITLSSQNFKKSTNPESVYESDLGGLDVSLKRPKTDQILKESQEEDFNEESNSRSIMVGNDGYSENSYDSEVDEGIFIEIPEPGTLPSMEMRLVPNKCAICLSPYEVGETLVWSSNDLCQHAFHSQCMQNWILQQRGPPHCPCCRQIFLVDPYETNNENQPYSIDPSSTLSSEFLA